MNPTLKHIFSKYQEFVIPKIESEKKKADIFTKGSQDKIFARIRNLLWGW